MPTLPMPHVRFASLGEYITIFGWLPRSLLLQYCCR